MKFRRIAFWLLTACLLGSSPALVCAEEDTEPAWEQDISDPDSEEEEDLPEDEDPQEDLEEEEEKNVTSSGPSLKGRAVVGETLSIADGSQAEGGAAETARYLWSRRLSTGDLVTLGTGKTYTVTAADAGCTVLVTITYGAAGGESLTLETGKILSQGSTDQTGVGSSGDNLQEAAAPVGDIWDDELEEVWEEDAPLSAAQEDTYVAAGEAELETDWSQEEMFPVLPEETAFPDQSEDSSSYEIQDQDSWETREDTDVQEDTSWQDTSEFQEDTDVQGEGSQDYDEDEGSQASEDHYDSQDDDDGYDSWDYDEEDYKDSYDSQDYGDSYNSQDYDDGYDSWDYGQEEEDQEDYSQNYDDVSYSEDDDGQTYRDADLDDEDTLSGNETAPVSAAGLEEDQEKEEEVPAPAFRVDIVSVTFSSVREGYDAAQIPPQTICVENQGNVPLTFLQPTCTMGQMLPSALSQTKLQPGETATFTITPASGLKAGDYLDEIIIQPQEELASQTVQADIHVDDPPLYLVSVEVPSGTIEAANGTRKSADALGLPQSLLIHTNQDDMEAAVTWDLASSAYNPAEIQEQTFSVKGRLSLPEGMENPDDVSEIVKMAIKVLEREPILADQSQNAIEGVDSAFDYTTETKITFRAKGAGMDNTSPGEGDTRYLPSSWKVLESRSFEGDPYEASFRIAKPGPFRLSVVYEKQEYDGEQWTNLGQEETKQVSFNISGDQDTLTVTPAPSRNISRRPPVQTGDDTPIAKYLLVLALAAAVVLGLVVVMKRRK